jgi:tryptophanyl-tRNA synthetase
VVTPYTVQASGDGIDYDKLIVKFGCKYIQEDIISRVERLTNRRAHRFLRRGIFFSHKDLDLVLNLYERNIPFYLYTGRGPSSDALHLGHMVPFIFTLYLQEAFNVPLVIQITDDEKFFWKNLTLKEAYRLGIENVKDIIACGYDVRKTFIFSDLEYVGTMYPNVCRMQKAFSLHNVKKAFGFDEDAKTSINCKIAYPAIQAAPSFSNSFPHLFGDRTDIPCLIPCAIDQDPYFRLTRDVAQTFGYIKPALIHAKFFPALQGAKSKMSSSNANSAIFMTDTKKQIVKKIKSFAFSGGGATKELQEEHGADTEIDVSYQWLRFFMEDDEKLAHIEKEYAAGRMYTSQVKDILITEVNKIVGAHQKARASVTTEIAKTFMSTRNMQHDQQ